MRWQPAAHPASDELLFVDGDTGRIHGVRHPSSPRVDELVWGREGTLAVSCYVHNVGGARSDVHVDLFHDGERRRTIDLGARRIQASHSVSDASGIAWSPDSHGVALLLDGQEVAVYDARSAELLSKFEARAPDIPPGFPEHYTRGHRPDYGFPGDLVWLQGQRIARIAPHFVSVWTLDGQKIAELVAPG